MLKSRTRWAEEKAQLFRTSAALADNPCLVPSTHGDCSPPSVTPAPGDPVCLASTDTHVYTATQRHTLGTIYIKMFWKEGSRHEGCSGRSLHEFPACVTCPVDFQLKVATSTLTPISSLLLCPMEPGLRILCSHLCQLRNPLTFSLFLTFIK